MGGYFNIKEFKLKWVCKLIIEIIAPILISLFHRSGIFFHDSVYALFFMIIILINDIKLNLMI